MCLMFTRIEAFLQIAKKAASVQWKINNTFCELIVWRKTLEKLRSSYTVGSTNEFQDLFVVSFVLSIDQKFRDITMYLLFEDDICISTIQRYVQDRYKFDESVLK